nr:NACHT domain-containing protein [Actinomyces mediterranea]
MLDAEGRVLVSELFEMLYPYEDKTANRNRNLNRLMMAVNKVAEEQGLAFSMCITPSKRGGASSRWVWFEGPELESPQFDADVLRAIPEDQLAEQRAVESGVPTVVLLTFNPNETRAVWKEFRGSEKEPDRRVVRGERSYYHLADISGMRIIHAISGQTTGEAQYSAIEAVQNWNPTEVYAVGIAFGVEPGEQQIGDVLVSEAILNYMHVRVEPNGHDTQRGFPRPASDVLLSRVRELEHARRGQEGWPRIHQGLVLSGDALVDNKEYRDELRARHVRIVGGEMEGSGIERACREKTRWLLVKGICDWAEEKNNPHKERDQKIAAEQAAKVVHAIIERGTTDLPARRPVNLSPSVATMGDFDPVFAGGGFIEDPRAMPVSLDKWESTPIDESGRPILEALLEWVSDPKGEQFFALLGEYGMGKTVTSQRLAKELEKRRENDPTLPIPLYFDLKKIVRADEASSLRATVEVCMRDGWLPKESKHYTWDRFVAWLSDSPCLVIFDGLDELLVKFNERTGLAFTQQLLGVIDVVPSELRSQTKVMLTCRTQYFPTLRAQQNHFLLRNRTDLTAQSYRAMTLLPLTEKQVRKYLEAAVPSIPVDVVMETIRNVHNLSELSERPYTLKLISKQIPELEDRRASGEAVSGVTLYELMTEEWLDRDDLKHYISREHKPLLVMALAAHLWRSGTSLLPVSELHDWFHEWVASEARFQRRYSNADLERLEEDLRTATFLSREDAPSAGFRFAHTSLFEYFLARHLAESVKRNACEGWRIPVPSRETLTFLGELFQTEYSDALQHLTRWRTSYRPQVSELLLAYALHAHRQGLPMPLLRGIKLDGAQLDEIVIQGSASRQLDLTSSSFVGCSLRRAVFQEVNLNHADFTDARLTQATFTNTRSKGALWPSGHSGATWASMEKEMKSVHQHGQIILPALGSGELALSADGSRVAAGGWDGSVRVWDVDSGETVSVLSVLEGHTSRVVSVAWSADGSRVVAGGWDGSVRVWDVDSGETVSVLEGHTAAVVSVAWSAVGSRVVTGGWDGSVRVWDVDSGETVSVLEGHTAAVGSVAWSAVGSRVVAGGEDGSVRVWDVDSGETVSVLEGHTSQVESVAWSAVGSRVVAGAWDGSVRVWDVDSGETVSVLSVLEGQTSPVVSLAVSADGSRVAAGGKDGSVRVWDVDSGETVSVLEGHTSPVGSVAWSADGSRVVAGGWDGSVRVWDVDSGETVSVLEGHTAAVVSVAGSLDGSRVVAGGWDGSVRVWDVDSGETVSVLEGHTAAVGSVAGSVDGSRVVAGGWDGSVRVWDAKNRKLLRTAVQTRSEPGYPAGFASWRPGLPMIDVVEGGAWRRLWILNENSRVSRPVIPSVSHEPPVN